MAHQSPKTFRDFLLRAPYMFLELGEKMGAISHIVSFWRYRFPPGRDTDRSDGELSHHLPGLRSGFAETLKGDSLADQEAASSLTREPPDAWLSPLRRPAWDALKSSPRLLLAAILFIVLKVIGLVVKFALIAAVLGFVAGLLLARSLAALTPGHGTFPPCGVYRARLPYSKKDLP